MQTDFPSVPFDRMVNVLEAIGHMQIQLAMQFSHRLDVDRLAQACVYLCDAEPLVACRLEIRANKALWRFDAGLIHRVFHTVDDIEAEFSNILDPEQGPQLRVFLQARHDGDLLLLQVRHELADAGGLKQLARRLAAIYRQQASNPGYQLKANQADRHHRQLVRQFSPLQRARIATSAIARAVRNNIGTPYRQPDWPQSNKGSLQFTIRHIGGDAVTRMKQVGAECNATINDLLIAAFIRAYTVLCPDQKDLPQRLDTTVDLRRYLPQESSNSITNLSGFEHYLFRDTGVQSFSKLLNLVVQETARRKAAYPGMDDLIVGFPLAQITGVSRARFERLLKFALNRKSMPQGLTNMGPIHARDTEFDRPAQHAYLIVPPAHHPYLMMGASGYAGGLCLSCGYSSGVGGFSVPDFLDAMVCLLAEEAG